MERVPSARNGRRRRGGGGRPREKALKQHAFQRVDIITVRIPETGGFANGGGRAVFGKELVGDAAHAGCRKNSCGTEIRDEAGPERKQRGGGVCPGVFRKKAIIPISGGGVFRPVEYGTRTVGRIDCRTFAADESGQQKESQQQGEQL